MVHRYIVDGLLRPQREVTWQTYGVLCMLVVTCTAWSVEVARRRNSMFGILCVTLSGTGGITAPLDLVLWVVDSCGPRFPREPEVEMPKELLLGESEVDAVNKTEASGDVAAKKDKKDNEDLDGDFTVRSAGQFEKSLCVRIYLYGSVT